MKKIAVLITFIFILIYCISCSNDSSGDDIESTATTLDLDIETEIAKTEGIIVDDELPNINYEGKTINISINSFCESGFFVEDINGDVLNDTIYTRNTAVEERFNIKLQFHSGDYAQVATNVRTTVLAGEDAYQIVAQHAIHANSIAINNILMNWYDVPYVDFAKPWWSPSNIDDLTINGVALLAVGDFSLTTIGRTYCMFYNKSYAETYGLPDMYKLVNDGKWTIDQLSELTKDIYLDLDNNDVRDTDDYYGFTTSVASNIGTYLWALGGNIYTKNADGNLEMNFYNERTITILEKLIELCHQNQGTYYDVNYKNEANNIHYVGPEKFAKGTTLFANGFLESGIVYLRDLTDDYGIIPYPKLNESQDDYRTIVDGGFTILCIPKTVIDMEMAGIIVEALCAETHNSVVPVYTELALKTKGTRDTESITMIDYILTKRVFDFGYVYDNWKGFGFVLESLVKSQDNNLTSYYESTINSVLENYDSMIAIFENY